MSIHHMTILSSAAVALAFAFTAAPSHAATTCAAEMKTVKAEWDKAPSGAQKDAALDYYTNAGMAEKTKNEKTCLVDLDAAKMVLTMKPMTVAAGTTCVSEMATVKAAWDKAAAGPKKDAALVHYAAAEASEKGKKEATCMIHAEAAAAALK